MNIYLLAKAVEDPVLFFAEKIHGCFTNMGTNDNMLIRLCVSRSEVSFVIEKSMQTLFCSFIIDLYLYSDCYSSLFCIFLLCKSLLPCG